MDDIDKKIAEIKRRLKENWALEGELDYKTEIWFYHTIEWLIDQLKACREELRIAQGVLEDIYKDE